MKCVEEGSVRGVRVQQTTPTGYHITVREFVFFSLAKATLPSVVGKCNSEGDAVEQRRGRSGTDPPANVLTHSSS